MYLLTSLVFGFIVFVILYARYMNVCGSLSKRRIQLGNLRDQVELRVKNLKSGTAQIHRETEDAVARLEDIKHYLGEEGNLNDDP
ncbi:hypothetical protein [Maridesulfovibrio zosterae]|uniref:hypothetical protein n=1 Tax=Maridesulfovibrio zosterae TaxID=82171 RepID=UPI000427B002|nr:hypothetical protein [Maridesulfovibrio zosterae]